MKKKFFYAGILFCVALGMVSCNNETDELSKLNSYTGTWKASETGSVLLMMDGQEASSIPVSNSGDITVSRVGTDSLKIGSSAFNYITGKVSGDSIIFKQQTESKSVNGASINQTSKTTGKIVSSSSIIITTKYSGTWDMLGMISGEISGTDVLTLSK